MIAKRRATARRDPVCSPRFLGAVPALRRLRGPWGTLPPPLLRPVAQASPDPGRAPAFTVPGTALPFFPGGPVHARALLCRVFPGCNRTDSPDGLRCPPKPMISCAYLIRNGPSESISGHFVAPRALAGAQTIRGRRLISKALPQEGRFPEVGTLRACNAMKRSGCGITGTGPDDTLLRFPAPSTSGSAASATDRLTTGGHRDFPLFRFASCLGNKASDALAGPA